MSSPYVQQPLIRTTVLLTPQQREALRADAAETGRGMSGIVRDLIDKRYFGDPKTLAGWKVSATVQRPIDPSEAPALPRARLREWISRSGRRR